MDMIIIVACAIGAVVLIMAAILSFVRAVERSCGQKNNTLWHDIKDMCRSIVRG